MTAETSLVVLDVNDEALELPTDVDVVEGDKLPDVVELTSPKLVVVNDEALEVPTDVEVVESDEMSVVAELTSLSVAEVLDTDTDVLVKSPGNERVSEDTSFVLVVLDRARVLVLVLVLVESLEDCGKSDVLAGGGRTATSDNDDDVDVVF